MAQRTSQNEMFTGTISRRGLIYMTILAGGLTLFFMTIPAASFIVSLITALTEGGTAALVFVAAGGYGYLALRKIMPESAPRALRCLTACALGLWLLSTAVLAVGSFTHGLLNKWVWWPVVGVGIALAAWQGRKSLETWKPASTVDGRALIWLIVAAAAAMWIAGATMHPHYVPLIDKDNYDVLEYHLQTPREYFDAGHIAPLQHNIYSYYPMHVEMLMLLGMCIRGGPMGGLYLATFLHGLFGALTVAGIFSSLKRDDESRGRFAATLFATTPFVICLSWLAMVELSQVCYMAFIALWLRQWMKEPSARCAAIIGLLVGVSCAAKYLSVGLIALPVLAVMLVLSLKSPRRIAQTVLAGFLTLAVMSPWLIRNYSSTGNPVFPLEMDIFGRGHLSEQSAQRWQDGHGTAIKPPVPRPPGWSERPQSDRLELFYRNFVADQRLGWVAMLAAAVAICAMFAGPKAVDPWDWALLAMLVLQVLVWVFSTHEMPSRFITPALACIVLLAGGGMARLAKVQRSPLRRKDDSSPSNMHWGRTAATAALVVASITNLLVVYAIYSDSTGPGNPEYRLFHGMPAQEMMPLITAGEVDKLSEPARKFVHENSWVVIPDDARVMLIGEAQAYDFPNPLYATVFDDHPLQKMIKEGKTPRQIMDELVAMKVKLIWVNWIEILRLTYSYGFPLELTPNFQALAAQGRPPELPILEEMKPLGLKEVKSIFMQPAPSTSSGQATQPSTQPTQAVQRPILVVTVYSLDSQAGTAGARATTQNATSQSSTSAAAR